MKRLPSVNPALARMFSLRNKVALVTGASGGIGRSFAIALAQAGAKVALHGTKPDNLETSRQFVEKVGGKGIALTADLAKMSSCKKLIDETVEEFGRLDILVNCAGMNRRKPIRDVPEEDFDTIVAVNLKSLYFLSQKAYPIMRDQGGGKIINVGSITSTDGVGGISVYGATKGAVWQLTKTQALEWAKDNIQVNCIAPGFMMTPLTEKGVWGDPHRREWLLDRIPMKRPGKPEELNGALLLLASDAGSYITGQIITVDGGYLAGGSWLLENE